MKFDLKQKERQWLMKLNGQPKPESLIDKFLSQRNAGRVPRIPRRGK